MFQTSPILFNLIHLICQILVKFSRVESKRIVSKLRKRQTKFRILFTVGNVDREISVDIAVDIAVDTRSKLGRHSVDSRSI